MVQLLGAPTQRRGRSHTPRPEPAGGPQTLHHAGYRSSIVRLHLTTRPRRRCRVRLFDRRTQATLRGVVRGATQSDRLAVFGQLAAGADASGLWSVVTCSASPDTQRHANLMPPAALPYRGVAGAHAVLHTLERLVHDRAVHCAATRQAGLPPSRNFKGVLCIIDDVGRLAIDDPDLVARIANVRRTGPTYGIAVWLGMSEPTAATPASVTSALTAMGGDDAVICL